MPRIPSTSTAKDISSVLFFSEFAKALLETLESGRSVEHFVFDMTGDLPVEFEVCIKRVAGKAIPRITQTR